MHNKIVLIALLISFESYSQSLTVCTDTVVERRQALDKLYTSAKNYLYQHGKYPDFTRVESASINKLVPIELKKYKIGIDKDLDAIYYSCTIRDVETNEEHTETMFIDLSDGSGFSIRGVK